MALLSFILCVVVMPATMVAMEDGYCDQVKELLGSKNGSLGRGIVGSVLALFCFGKGATDVCASDAKHEQGIVTNLRAGVVWLLSGCGATWYAYRGFKNYHRLKNSEAEGIKNFENPTWY